MAVYVLHISSVVTLNNVTILNKEELGALMSVGTIADRVCV
jgi:hypothetical protein